jgi:protoporphyrinogen oxidase
MHIVILGGGACGMMAAWELCCRGARVTLIERERRPGGLCGTVEDGGFHFDLGGHRVISQNRELVERLQVLMGGAFLSRVRSSVILNRGQQFSYPLDGLELLRKVPLGEAAAIWSSYAQAALQQRLRGEPDHSFEDWVVHRFGRALYDRFFGPYTEKLWGIPPTEISADWAAQRISLLDLSDVLLRLLRLRRGGARTYAKRYLYPRHGIGQLFVRMGEEIEALGGQLLYGRAVIGLGTEAAPSAGGEPRRRVRTVKLRDADAEADAARTEIIEADHVISTLALPQLVAMLAQTEPVPVAATAALRAAERLRFRGVRFLNIKLDRPRFSPHTWMYVSEPRYLATRIQEPSHRSPYAAPPGKTSIMLEIPCQAGGPVWSMPDGALYERCLRDLMELGFPEVRRDTLGYFCTYVEEGYPIYERDYLAQRQLALDYVARVDNLTSCGRQGAFRYVFMDTAMEMGQLAAARALQGRSATAEAAGLRSDKGLIETRSVIR